MKWFVFSLVFLMTACARPLPPGVTELTYATPYSPGHPFSRADQRWIDHIERVSEGSIRIRPLWSGSVLSSDMSMEELRHGVADIGLITPIYVRGGTHLIRVQSGFYSGVTGFENQVALYRCIEAAEPQIAKELTGLKVLAIQGGANPGIITRTRAVRSIDDLEGMRIRAPSELLPLLEKLGADAVELPMGEVYSALAKGVIDGVVAPPDTFKAMHFADVANYYTELLVPRGAYPARAMGMRSWNKLSDKQRELLRASTPVWEAALANEIRSAVVRGLKEAKTRDIVFSPIDTDQQAQFDALYLAEAEVSARGLGKFGIDAKHAFRTARNSIQNKEIHCRSGS